MKTANLLIFVTQLGLTVVLPPVVLTLLALWVRENWGWGNWVVILGIVLGVLMALSGLGSTLKAMARMSRDKKEEPPPLAFNDHD